MFRVYKYKSFYIILLLECTEHFLLNSFFLPYAVWNSPAYFLKFLFNGELSVAERYQAVKAGETKVCRVFCIHQRQW